MKLLAFITFLVFCALVSKAQDTTLHHYGEEIKTKVEGGFLYGSLLEPKDFDKGSPIVLIIAGSGPTDRNGNNTSMKNNSLLQLSEGLQENGIATLRYDKRGIGKSSNVKVNESELEFRDFVEDAKSWVNILEKYGYNNISIAGHSEGSLIGMMAANEMDVKSYLSLAGAGRPIGTILKEQLSERPAFFRDSCYSIIDSLEKGVLLDTVSPFVYQMFRPSIQPYLISWMKISPQKELQKLSIPIKIIQGTTDIQVQVEDAKLLAKAAPEASLTIIEGMNHVFKDASADRTENLKTYSDPGVPINQELIQSISEFLLHKKATQE